MIFAQQDPIVFEGQLGEDEWNQAQRFNIDYEIQQGIIPLLLSRPMFLCSTLPRISMLVLTLKQIWRVYEVLFVIETRLFRMILSCLGLTLLVMTILFSRYSNGIQPHLSFFIWGNNNYKFKDRFDAYRLDNVQLYLKFKYQI